MMNVDQALKLAQLVLEILLILSPAIVAFYLKRREALQTLLAAVPDVYTVVQRERMREGGLEVARTAPQDLALATMRKALPPGVVNKHENLIRMKLQAEHDRRRMNGEVE